MGCVPSKQTVTVTPAADHSGAFRDNAGGGAAEVEILKKTKKKKKRTQSGASEAELSESGRASSNGGDSASFRLGNLRKYVEGEQVAAGWPAWLSAVAGEAIHGWVPLNVDSFEKLEKIGQGTYSNVFRARNLETGKIVALKKVRFDNFEPESVRFMAREILILRRLDHPNIIKLEGLITSRLSCSIYLVFEYMEHDISGLISCPGIKFSEAQVKCYMKQLLSGLEHCHSCGVMHRDIKGANLLVNDEGVLKIADFGLANFCSFGAVNHRQPLTSRVVTLWYRPPELLLGSTDYGASVDLWSVGCLFAELLIGKPVLQGRTEVEQLHKIFKLCGSPPEDYWKKSKLPHATLFKPQHPYKSSLWEAFKDLPKAGVDLIEVLLSVEPHKRGTASSALASEYFRTKPYACDPSSLPKYPPSKEIDAKHREEAQRKKPCSRTRGPDPRIKLTKRPNSIQKLMLVEPLSAQARGPQKINRSKVSNHKEEDTTSASVIEPPKPSTDIKEEPLHVKNASQGDVPFSGPLQVSGSSGFAWAKRRVDDSSIRSRSRSSSRSLIFEPLSQFPSKNGHEPKGHDNVEHSGGRSQGEDDTYNGINNSMRRHWRQLERPDSFDASDGYHSQELSLALYQREEVAAKRLSLVCQDQGEKVEFSGPLLSQSHRVDELLERHERHIRQVVRRSWFQRGTKNGKRLKKPEQSLKLTLVGP